MDRLRTRPIDIFLVINRNMYTENKIHNAIKIIYPILINATRGSKGLHSYNTISVLYQNTVIVVKYLVK